MAAQAVIALLNMCKLVPNTAEEENVGVVRLLGHAASIPMLEGKEPTICRRTRSVVCCGAVCVSVY